MGATFQLMRIMRAHPIDGMQATQRVGGGGKCSDDGQYCIGDAIAVDLYQCKIMASSREKPMQIRDAKKSELHAIVEMLADDELGAARERVEEPLSEKYVEAFDAMAMARGNRLIVAVDGKGEVRGCFQLTIIPGISRMGMTRAIIEGVRVHASHRGTGLGTKLMEYAISEARAAKCGLVQLTTSHSREDAQRFYEKLGFEPSHVGMKLKI
jgi:ribosomal protein S18 acetylase RimI-like enzyme